MKANETNLQGILGTQNQYIIPVFQRYYSWGKENWEELWEDIINLSESPVEENASHFMGSLVFVPEHHSPERIPGYQVIDGQQRIITISLILCAIRNIAYQGKFDNLAEEINITYLVHQFKKEKERFRVYPRFRDRDDFFKAVLREGKPDDRIKATLDYFTKRITETLEDESEESLRKLFNIIIAKLEFVNITLRRENPYNIFRSLNSTGVDLSEGDLIRNFVFMHIDLETQEEFDNKFWIPVESHFENEKGELEGKLLSDFFRDYLMKDGQYVPLKQIFKSFEKKYSKSDFDPVHLSKDLDYYANFYDIIRGVKKHSEKGIERSLEWLRNLDSSTTFPLLLNLMHKYDQEQIDIDELTYSIEMISGFIMRRFICRESSRAYSRQFVVACWKLGEDPTNNLQDYLVSRGFPGDQRFMDDFVQLNIYRSGYCRHILETLERQHMHKEAADLSKAQIEHIMPQTLTNEWRNELGPDADEIHERWKDTMGNLTLSAYNPELSNKPFKQKREEYLKSNISITRDLKKYSEWTEAEIKQRGNNFAEMVAKIWSSPRGLSPGEVFPPLDYDAEVTHDDVEFEALRHMLARIRISRGQLILYKVLLEAGESGIELSDLATAMNRTESQLSGVLGAVGARINHTPGLNDDKGIWHIMDFMEQNGKWYYRMNKIFYDALKAEDLLV